MTEAIQCFIDGRNRDALELQSVGFVLALNPNSPGIPPFTYPPHPGGRSTILVPEAKSSFHVGKDEIGKLFEAVVGQVSSAERTGIFELTSGHPFLVQVYVSARKQGDSEQARTAVEATKKTLGKPLTA